MSTTNYKSEYLKTIEDFLEKYRNAQNPSTCVSILENFMEEILTYSIIEHESQIQFLGKACLNMINLLNEDQDKIEYVYNCMCNQIRNTNSVLNDKSVIIRN
jgi:hypothetical protein